jgi:hypothetical protein
MPIAPIASSAENPETPPINKQLKTTKKFVEFIGAINECG